MSPKQLINKVIIEFLSFKGKRGLNNLESVSKYANQYSLDLLLKLMKDNQDTEYGKAHHFSEVHSYEDYKRLVPLSDYDQYAELIERTMNKGEENLVTAYPIVSYAITSGSIGAYKYIPQTKEAFKQYKKLVGNTVFGSVKNYYKKTLERPFPRVFF